MSETIIPIHEVVRERYSTLATNNQNAPGSCCGDMSCCSTDGLYDGGLLEGLPVDVTNLSLG